MDVVTGFATLFHGSSFGYGTEEGGCDKDVAKSYYERIIDHLEGTVPMGVYPLVHNTTEWVVGWGCVDFDEGEEASLAYARNVAGVIDAVGGKAWIERSRSKGYHVWLFLDGWFPAVLVREALLGACQVVDAPTKEINPKSVSLNEGQLGNYVRLPYPGALMDDNAGFPRDRRVVIESDPEAWPLAGSGLSVEWFVNEALRTRSGQAVLEALQGMYEPPKRIVPAPPPVGDTGDMHKRMSGLAYTIWKDGPRQDAGRGHTLFKLACVLAEAGHHTEGEAFALCIEADQRWGKFHHRANGEATIEKMVAKAYGH
jgi:hypothetical protein